MPLTVPHLSQDGKTLIVPMANGTTVDVPIESVEYYSDAMIGFTTLRKQPHVIRFDSRRNNGKIARKLLDSKKHIIASKSEPKAETATQSEPETPHAKPPQEIVDDLIKAKEQAEETLALVSDVLFKRNRAILTELLGKDEYFLKVWKGLQNSKGTQNGYCALFDERNKKLVIYGTIPPEEKPKAARPKRKVTAPLTGVDAIWEKVRGSMHDIQKVSKVFEIEGEQWYFVNQCKPKSDEVTRTFIQYEGKGKLLHALMTELLGLGEINEPIHNLDKEQ